MPTRDGEFFRAPDGTLRNAQGWRHDGFRVPSDAVIVLVGEDGTATTKLQKGGRP